MYGNLLKLEEIKALEVGILDYIVSICKKNKIQYFLAYGTLLGAIRHKGFIPWDDDIDIFLMRPEYERLLEAIKKDNNKRYKVLTPDTKNYIYAFSKVVDTKTIVIENNIAETEEMGLWVDIFPYDIVKKEKSILSYYIYFLDRARASSANATFRHDKYSFWMYLPWKISRLFGNEFFKRRISKLSIRYNNQSNKYNKVAYWAGIVMCNQCFPKDLFSEITEVEFEGKLYDAPKDYDVYLRLCYGEYMKMPPENQRKYHNMEAYLKCE